VIDASGLQGVLATRYLKSREMAPQFANIALGSYWKGHTPYVDKDGNSHPGVFYQEALPNGLGWVWAIPLHNETISVGVVVHRDILKELRAESGDDLEKIYEEQVMSCSSMRATLSDAKRVDEVRPWRDYSYIASRFAGPGFRLAGDSAGFLDPLFSSGVQFALFGGLAAAASICGAKRGDCTEEEAQSFHDSMIRKPMVTLSLAITVFYQHMKGDKDKVVIPDSLKTTFRSTFDSMIPLMVGTSGALNSLPFEEKLDKAANSLWNAARAVHGLPTDEGAKATRESFGRFDVDELNAGFRIRAEKGNLGLDRG
jgi:flavin-dependent dehydrogenase